MTESDATYRRWFDDHLRDYGLAEHAEPTKETKVIVKLRRRPRRVRAKAFSKSLTFSPRRPVSA